jgi:hypothetical protein
MSEHSGLITRGNPRERAVLIAGALAEMGVQDLAVGLSGGETRVLWARKTDLPGLLGAAETWSLASRSVKLDASPEGVRWATHEPEVAQLFRAISGEPAQTPRPSPEP